MATQPAYQHNNIGLYHTHCGHVFAIDNLSLTAGATVNAAQGIVADRAVDGLTVITRVRQAFSLESKSQQIPESN